MDLAKEELEALTLLAQTGQQSISPEVCNMLAERGLIQRELGRWIVTSRGHALILRKSEE